MPRAGMINRPVSNPVLTASQMNKILEKGGAINKGEDVIERVLNPGGICLNGKLVLLSRNQYYTGYSGLAAVETSNRTLIEGSWRWKFIPGSLILPELYVKGYEDARISLVEDIGIVVVFVSSYDDEDKGSVVSLMTTENFSGYDIVGDVVFDGELGKQLMSRNKDASVVDEPVKMDGDFWDTLINRPIINGVPTMYLSFCKRSKEGINLKHWSRHKVLAKPRGGNWWDQNRVGLSPQSIKIPDKLRTARGLPYGRLLIDHGVKGTAAGQGYKEGGMWLCLEEDRIGMTHRTEECITDSIEDFGQQTDVHSANFCCAAWYDDTLNGIVKFFGIGDTTIGVEVLDAEKVISRLVPVG